MSDQAKQVLLFDTTLRDGEQSPGASMSVNEKVKIAVLLDEMGVDIIEAGFPIASQGDFESVSEIAATVKNATVAGLSRASKKDIDRAWEALKTARKPRIHSFLSTSPLHMRYKLCMEPADVLQAIKESVSYARTLCDNVEWSPEDATRSEESFLCKAVETAISAGARTINIADTVGYTTPDEFKAKITMLRNQVPNIDLAVISVHCHNDLGLAVANSLAALSAGARQIECTINGLGERAGNAALEEIVMALRVRKDQFNFYTGVNTQYISRISKLVSNAAGFPVQYNKAIVGKNAFAHEAGIHQDGMLKNTKTYEIMRPEDVGLSQSSLVMGKHSGRHAFRRKVIELGYDLGQNALEDAFFRFKQLADKKKVIYDDDIVALVDDEVLRDKGTYILESIEIYCGAKGAHATVKIAKDGKSSKSKSQGDGPIDAIFTAIKKLSHENPHLDLYQVGAVTGGSDAQAEVVVRLQEGGHLSTGRGADTDTLLASARAYINALNKLILRKRKSALPPIAESA